MSHFLHIERRNQNFHQSLSACLLSNFELKFLLNFLDILKKFIQKETSDLDKMKNTKNHTNLMTRHDFYDKTAIGEQVALDF